MTGKLYGIGVGPGDPELLTLKAKRILEHVDVLLIPKSRIEKRSIALTIVQQVIDRSWEQVELLLPMTTDRAALQEHWMTAAEQIVDILKQGKTAAFITLGDPSLYSTFTYIYRHVTQILPKAEIEIVPGVSSIHSVAASMQVPLAESDESLAIVPALKEHDALHKVISNFDNVVLMKVGNQIDKIADMLDDIEGEKRVYYASRCGFADGYSTNNLQELKGRKLDYLSTIVIKRGDQA